MYYLEPDRPLFWTSHYSKYVVPGSSYQNRGHVWALGNTRSFYQEHHFKFVSSASLLVTRELLLVARNY